MKKATQNDVKRYREYLNDLPGNKHTERRFGQRSRPYGDYLYAQDKERFYHDLAQWVAEQTSR